MRIKKNRYSRQWVKDKIVKSRVYLHFQDFSAIWFLLLLVLLGAITPFRWLAFIGLCCIPILLTVAKRPLNIVYGLIGTSGSIQIFFFSFIVICLVFFCIYYFGFFKKAYISYDLNQPHVHFVQFSPKAHVDTVFSYEPVYDSAGVKIDSVLVSADSYYVTCCAISRLDSAFYANQNPDYLVTIDGKRDTVFIYSERGERYSFIQSESYTYQRVKWEQVLRNTILTSLIQEPSDLFAAASIFNLERYHDDEECVYAAYDKSRTTLFHWILILQILISWILLGVFISILYNKFRYES